MTTPAQLAEFQDCFRASKRIVALVGAGLSASSGLSTFRGVQGLWKNFNMIDLATPDAFYIDPGLVWQFYSWRRHHALRAKPNAGHYALAELSKNPKKEFVTITQNVDGLSARAGHERDDLYEIHGSLFDLRCTSFTCTYIDRGNEKDPLTPALDNPNEYEESKEDTNERDSSDEFNKDDKRDTGSDSSGEQPTTYQSTSLDPLDHLSAHLLGASHIPESPQFTPVKELSTQELPLCPACNSLMRPGVVWFGESLPLRVLSAIDDFLEEGPVDLIMVIGTSGTVYPANSYVDLVRARGGAVAIFNTDIEPEIMRGKVPRTYGFLGDAAEWLPRALEGL